MVSVSVAGWQAANFGKKHVSALLALQPVIDCAGDAIGVSEGVSVGSDVGVGDVEIATDWGFVEDFRA